MYVLVQLVEHGVKLRIARRRAVAARRVALPSLLDVGASQLLTPRRTPRRTPRLKPHAASHATSTLWKAGKALNVTQFHDFVCRLWKRRREGAGSSVQRCTMGQKCKFFTKNLHSLLQKSLTSTWRFAILIWKIVDSNHRCSKAPGAPVGMWTYGRVHTKFWQPHQPYLNQGGQIMLNLYYCPHQVLKATGVSGIHNWHWRLGQGRGHPK